MIISRTPFRISLFGGGTDYPAWYRQHGGAVLGTTINKYCYISLRALPPFFEHRHRFVYSRVECVNSLDEVQHPAIRAVLKEAGIDVGLEIHHDGDLPARSGLGSSSSFTVGLLCALRAFHGQMSSPHYLATEAIRIEQDVVAENVGSQDQVWAAYGGTNLIEFRQDGAITVSPIIMQPQRRQQLQSHMMLFFTGFSRIASEIAAKQIANMDKRRQQLRAMRGMVDEALEILQNGNRSIAEIGTLLHDGWMLKKELADNVSTGRIDEIYEAALAAGALGGKLLGAGGGGFMMLFVPPEAQQAVRERLAKLVEVSFAIGSMGSRVVVYEPSGFDHT
ncbi:MAG: kinase [Rhodospirillales bacterium]|nr:kinase [Rhodospirillales bacterium]